MTYADLLRYLLQQEHDNPHRLHKQVVIILGRSIIVGITHGGLLSQHETRRLGMPDEQLVLYGDSAPLE